MKSKHISIKSVLPAPGTKKLYKRLKKVESRSMHGQLPIAWESAKDFYIYDISGNKFIDFTSTIFVANVGHSNNRIKKYIKKTLDNNFLHSYVYINKIRANYIEKLIKFAGKGFQKAFLMSSGTEATEAAFKLMRMYGIKKKKRKLGIICFEGNWHGRTLASQMMSGNEDQKKWIGYKDKNIHHLPFPYPWDISESKSEKYLEASLSKLKNKIDLKKDICGVMIETFQGWGALFYPKKYIMKLSKICKKNDILITFDEMQAGFSRTGKNFGFQHYDITPDLICCGKGMGGGVPLSGVIGRADLLDLPEIGNMSSTNSANPISCSAGLAVIEEIQKKNLTKETKIKGQILHRELKKISTLRKNLFKVYGKGLIAAMIFEKNIPNLEQKIKYFVERCIEDGLLLVYTGRESIKLGPPLIISKNAIKTATNIIKKNILSVFND